MNQKGRQHMPATPLELARVAATAADERKASDIVLLDLSSASDVCDYFLVCSSSSKPQVDAVVEHIEEKLQANCHAKPLSVEGKAAGSWVLLDFGPLVVHVFKPETRDFYRLERLWGDAPRVTLGLVGEAAMEGTPETVDESASSGE